MSRRIRLKNPSAGTTLLFGGLIAGGVWYYFHEKGKKEDSKKLKAKQGPRNVQILADLSPDSLPKPPLVVLGYCDTEVGRAILDAYVEQSRTGVKVPVYAVNLTKLDPSWDCVASPALLVASRMNGSWLELLSGEDQGEFVLTAPDADRLKIVMDWANGGSELPLESSTFKGDASTLWGEWGTPPIPIDIDVGTTYYLPIDPPDPAMEVELTNSNEGPVEAYTLIKDFEKPTSQQYVGIVATQEVPGAMISAIQGDWKKQVLVRPREA